MAERPSSLVRRSLANDPLLITLVFFGSLAAWNGLYLASDATHGDHGSAVAASFVLAIVVTLVVWRVRKWRWWRRLHHLPVPLDVASYVRALDGFADHAHLEIVVTFAGPAPQLAGANLDGNVASLVSPRYRTRNRDSRRSMQYHTNYKLDQWFRRRLRELEKLHSTHAIVSITVNHRAG